MNKDVPIAPNPDSSDESRAFRNVLGCFATGVTVVSALDRHGQPLGLTVNSFNSLSLLPKVVLWSLASHLPFAEDFLACEYYAINILGADQQNISSLFASRKTNKFADVAYSAGLGGMPLISGCVGNIVCRNNDYRVVGDHYLFTSAVLEFSGSEGDPLLYYRGKYHRLG